MESVISQTTVCLSFDLEEHFQVVAFDSPMRRRHWDRFESRVEQNADKILKILRRRHARATFFVLGWVAERHPTLIQRLVDEGHEVAAHGYSNEAITAQTPRQFREDVRKTKAILEDLTGRAVVGYRAPNFSFSDEALWALPILVEEGYGYDSSVLPRHFHTKYEAHTSAGMSRIMTTSGPLWTLPPRAVRLPNGAVPVSGGVYFRVLPYRLFWRRLIARGDTNPVVLYLRVWEIDPAQPRMNGPALARFHHYCNLKKVESRLERLLRDIRTLPLREAMPTVGERSAPSLTTVGVP